MTVSAAGAAAMAAEQTGEEFVTLVTIDHEDLASPIRVCDQEPDLVSRGNTFVAFPFQIVLPEDRDDELPRSSIQVDCVDRTILAAIRALTSAPTVTVECVLRSQPDTLEYGPFEMTLRPIRYDMLVIEGDLNVARILDEPGEQLSYTPDVAPGLFQ